MNFRPTNRSHLQCDSTSFPSCQLDTPAGDERSRKAYNARDLVESKKSCTWTWKFLFSTFFRASARLGVLVLTHITSDATSPSTRVILILKRNVFLYHSIQTRRGRVFEASSFYDYREDGKLFLRPNREEGAKKNPRLSFMMSDCWNFSTVRAISRWPTTVYTRRPPNNVAS